MQNELVSACYVSLYGVDMYGVDILNTDDFWPKSKSWEIVRNEWNFGNTIFEVKTDAAYWVWWRPHFVAKVVLEW